METQQFVPTKTARKLLGVTSQTLRNWDESGKISTTKSPSGVRLYSYKDICYILKRPYTVPTQRKVAYCRVSSKKQENDLERQKDFFRTNYPDHELVTDVGSGINWKRKGFISILDSAMSGNLSELVVAHRDRLCRFAFDLLKHIFQSRGVELVVLDEENHKSQDTELADDILSIIHVYSCRNMGRRRYKNKKSEDLSDGKSKEATEEVDRDE